MSKKLGMLLVLAILVMGLAAQALAWSQTYVSSATWGAGSKDNSGYNSGLNNNFTSFDNRYGGSPQMGTRYIDSNGNGLVSYQWSNTGWLNDDRSVSYGAAECAANSGNGYRVYVYQCYTDNE